MKNSQSFFTLTSVKNAAIKMCMSVAFFFSFLSVSNAQWDTNTQGKCFCCEPYYNFPTAPTITGPTMVCGPATYSTSPCPGATYLWSISPALTTVSGANTPNFTINPPYASGNYTITVTIRCGQKTVTNQIQVTITKCDCKPDFLISLQEQAGGTYQANAQPATGSGCQNYWLLQEYNCQTNVGTGAFSYVGVSGTGVVNWGPYGAAPITVSASGYNVQFNNLTKGKCYRMWHYTLCCGEWKLQTKCFCLMSTLRTGRVTEAELNPTTETRAVQFNELPAELKRAVGSQRQE
jgi:PKD-like domain